MAKFEPARSLEQRVVELDAACERERRISRALRDVGVALGSTLDLDHLLELILHNITQALEADRATLYLLDEANDELVSRVVQGDEVRSIHLKNGQGIAGHVARTGKPLHVREAYRDPRFSHQWDLISGYRTHSVLAVPMKNHLGKTIGVVQVLNKLRGDFSEADADILHALATQAAVSIDNSRLFLSVTQKNIQLLEIKEQLEARVHDLKLLFDLESAMARAATLEDLFAAVLGEAMSTCDARTGAVAMREQDETPGSLHVLDGTTRTLKQYPFKNQGLIGYAIRSGKTVVSTDVFNDKRRNPPLEMRICKESNTAIAVPLEGEQGEPLGALALYDKRGSLFTDADLDLVQLLAANASTAIRLQLAREARERGDRLSTIGSLLSAVIHDLKTPLSVISGYVQLMVAAEARQKRSDYSELVLRQFDHIASMQREVLEFARGEKSILVRRVYLQKFFGELREALEPDLDRKKVRLVVTLDERGTARFDEGKIRRLVHNLARNAAEAMSGGGTFTIHVARNNQVGQGPHDPRQQNNALVLTFSDTGPGIPKEIEHRLFQSFVTSGKVGGTGLGLAIVKKIVEEHEGTVTVSSTSSGVTFQVVLPQKPSR